VCQKGVIRSENQGAVVKQECDTCISEFDFGVLLGGKQEDQ
jgi:hypothetical protein